MRILYLVSGKHVPTTRYRVMAYLPYLKALGHECHMAISVPDKYDYFRPIGWRPSRKLRRLVRWAHWLHAAWTHYDVIYLERELFDDPTWDLEQHFSRLASRFLWDVDDALFLRYPEKFDQIARMADAIIAGNRLLCQRIAPVNSKVVVIPTCVDIKKYPCKWELKTTSGPTVVGWMGTPSNLHNLHQILPALRQLSRSQDYELHVVSQETRLLKTFNFNDVPVRFVRWHPSAEIESLMRFDIGVMPLEPTDPWNHYKCGLKLLQYMAAGIPAVATPVGANADLVTHQENGFLPQSLDEWRHVLESLLCDSELRREVGSAARRTVETHYSVAANLPRMLRVLSTVQYGVSRPTARLRSERECP